MGEIGKENKLATASGNIQGEHNKEKQSKHKKISREEKQCYFFSQTQEERKLGSI